MSRQRRAAEAPPKIVPIIRRAVRTDYPDMLRIINGPDRSPGDYLTEAELHKFLRRENDGNVGYVAVGQPDHGHCMLAVALATIDREGVHAYQIVVDPAYRGRDVGRSALRFLADVGRDRCLRFLFVVVRDSNLPAHKFLRHLGFQAVQVRRKYYEDEGDDAYVFRYDLGCPRRQQRGRGR